MSNVQEPPKVVRVSNEGGMVAITYESAQIPVLHTPDSPAVAALGRWRIESRWVADGVTRWARPFPDRESAWGAFTAAVHTAPYPYGPHCAFRLVLVGPSHKVAPGRVVEGPAL